MPSPRNADAIASTLSGGKRLICALETSFKGWGEA
jgi:hypothetical protein